MHQAQVLGPLECVIADKLTWHGTDRGKVKPPTSAMGAEVSTSPHTEEDQNFKINGELLHGGQGKDNTLIHFACDHNIVGHPAEEPHTGGLGGLQPPRLETTGGAVHGADKKQMQKKNTQRRQRLKGALTAGSQWETHQVKTTPTSAPHIQPPKVYQNLMCPSGRALAHPAAGLLKEGATLGCPTRTGKPLTRDEIWEAVACGPHQSVLSLEALVHFAEEAAEKVRTKQAWIVLWDDIKDNPPKQLKISPIAAIPHKSKVFRSILDLSFQL